MTCAFCGSIKIWFLKLWGRAYLWQKRKCGFLTLSETPITVHGVVSDVFFPGDDSDHTFSIIPIGDDVHYTYYKGIKTREPSSHLGSLHCEVSPQDYYGNFTGREVLDSLKVNDEVIVTGTWSYDGAHKGKNQFMQIVNCILRHKAVSDGWTEVHPCTGITRA